MASSLASQLPQKLHSFEIAQNPVGAGLPAIVSVSPKPPRAEPILVQKVPDTGRLVALRKALRCLCSHITNYVDRHAKHAARTALARDSCCQSAQSEAPTLNQQGASFKWKFFNTLGLARERAIKRRMS